MRDRPAADRMLSTMTPGAPSTREQLARQMGVSPQRIGYLLKYARDQGWVQHGERCGRHRGHVLTALGRRHIAETGGQQ